MNEWFERFADKAAKTTGSSYAFIAALLLVVAWTVGGFFIGFGDTIYQLLINTATTIITFLMVFLIQAAQNKSDAATHLKLSEMIASMQSAHNRLIGAENMSSGEINIEIKRLQALKKDAKR